MDKLGFIPNPEQYAPAGDEVIFDNSIDALEFFRTFTAATASCFWQAYHSTIWPAPICWYGCILTWTPRTSAH